LKNNPGFAKKLGDSGRRYIESNLSIERIGKEMIAIFNKALRNHHE